MKRAAKKGEASDAAEPGTWLGGLSAEPVGAVVGALGLGVGCMVTAAALLIAGLTEAASAAPLEVAMLTAPLDRPEGWSLTLVAAFLDEVTANTSLVARTSVSLVTLVKRT